MSVFKLCPVGLIDCSVHEKNAPKLKYALELYQCLQVRMWSNTPYIARQLPGIGAQYAKTIAQANLINIDQLRNCDPGRFEQVCILGTGTALAITAAHSTPWHSCSIETLPLESSSVRKSPYCPI